MGAGGHRRRQRYRPAGDRGGAERGLKALTVGKNGATIRLVSAARDRFASILEVEFGGRRRRLTLPLPGDFQISNALVAAGLAIATGSEADAVFRRAARARGAPGRLERVGEVAARRCSSTTPTSPTRSKKRLRPCGLSCAAASSWCSAAAATAIRASGRSWARSRPASPTSSIVTDDNPRSEDPAAIRAADPRRRASALEIGDRGAAIRAGDRDARRRRCAGDRRQGSRDRPDRRRDTLPFSDADEARAALREAA